jgi:hypothetical protein
VRASTHRSFCRPHSSWFCGVLPHTGHAVSAPDTGPNSGTLLESRLGEPFDCSETSSEEVPGLSGAKLESMLLCGVGSLLSTCELSVGVWQGSVSVLTPEIACIGTSCAGRVQVASPGAVDIA